MRPPAAGEGGGRKGRRGQKDSKGFLKNYKITVAQGGMEMDEEEEKGPGEIELRKKKMGAKEEKGS